MYKNNMDGLSVTNYFALVATPGTDVLVPEFCKSQFTCAVIYGIERRFN
jgi:hypothetical protein